MPAPDDSSSPYLLALWCGSIFLFESPWNSRSLIKAIVGLSSKDSGEGFRQVSHSASGISSSGLSGIKVVQLSHLVVKCAPVLRQIGGESWVVHAVGHGALLSSARVNELSVCSKLSSMAACGQSIQPLHFGFLLHGSVLAVPWIGIRFSLVVSCLFAWHCSNIDTGNKS
ncbi:unnamed protein product [Brassica rapa subsp. trilocularis]